MVVKEGKVMVLADLVEHLVHQPALVQAILVALDLEELVVVLVVLDKKVALVLLIVLQQFM